MIKTLRASHSRKKGCLFDDWWLANADLEDIIAEAWQSITPCSKKAFLWMFAIINIVFLWHTMTFFFGNHDWGQIKKGIEIGWSLFDGRFGAGLIQQLVGGDILPVMNNLFCFCGFCLAMIALAKYWELPKTTLIYTIFGLFIMLLPYTYPWLQFVRSETHFWNILLIVWALFWVEKAGIKPQLAAFTLFVFSYGCYPATIQSIIIILSGRCLLRVWFDNLSFQELIKKYYKPALSIFLSLIIYSLVFALKKKWEALTYAEAIEPVTISVLMQHLRDLPYALWETFVDNSYYMPTWFKLFLSSSLLFMGYLMFQKSWQQNLLVILIMAVMIFSSQICNLLSVHDYTAQLRLGFFAVPYIYALGWAILLRQEGNFWKNTALILMMMAIYYAGLQAFRDQKVKYFDLQYEMKIMNNIRSRIKASPNFEPGRKYRLLMIGRLYSEDDPTPFDRFHKKINHEDGWAPFVPEWNAKDFFDFYEKDSFIKISFSEWRDVLPEREIKYMDIDYLLGKARPWPHPDSVYVDRYFIYIIFNGEALQNMREKIINMGYDNKDKLKEERNWDIKREAKPDIFI
ncbi:MAG: glucosyltransferase domain-containing protein [Alphaproteobacteria bacterium]|nr:glucosyltransferase domain-containing protein [Alphaproteobacteria bacterium]